MPAPKSRRLPPLSGVLVLVMASTGLVVVDLTIVAIGAPLISADIADGASVESVVVTYMVAMGALTQVVGSLSDRWGRRPLFLAGIAVFTLASLAAPLAPHLLRPNVARRRLGIGAYALTWRDGTPDAVVIDAAVQLAKAFSTDDSPSFVNGLLARVKDLKLNLRREQ